MARPIHSRLKIGGTLITQTGLHVGGLGESPDTDLPLARNGRGDFYISGTSITGVIRSWCSKNLEKEKKRINDLFQSDDSGQASFVTVDDIELKSIQEEIRDGVGIDRLYGTAAEQAKFDRAILPRGTDLAFNMTIEIERAADADAIKNIFGQLLFALQQGTLRFGASRTRGLGKVKLTKLKEIQELEMSKILDWLIQTNPPHEFSDKTDIENEIKKLTNGPSAPGKDLLTITINWQPKSPVMVKAGYDGIGVDTLPLVSGRGNGKVSLCLPGSSIKGAFRAQAERIVRTVCNKTATGKKFHDQIKLDLINELFGAKKERAKEEESEAEKKHLGLGALSVDDCYAKRSFLSDDWSNVETGEMDSEKSYDTQPLWKALKKLDDNKNVKTDTKSLRISHHVAIDRWTGGASEGALYSVLQPTPDITWEDITLTLDLSRVPGEATRKRCLMLLLLVLRDFAENRLPLGFATNRGMGEVKDVSIRTEGAYEIKWKNTAYDFTNCPSLKDDLEKEWKNV